ncbi:MAG: ABC transporter ATP-binding protein [Lachnospiraceae bacterium]|nr:ABC transporter ATP-binding protein [Lachnospiraceae bacterium]
MITLNNLEIGYDGVPILPPINSSFEDNKIYGILAKSGKGKSTLLKTISGLLRPVSGTVEINGTVYKGTDNNPVLMMHQKYTNLNWLTCTKNILIAQRNRKLRRDEDAEKVLDQVGLLKYKDKWPTQLSGGMQQRLALARVLYARPKYLLMDEPLSALDDKTRAVMQNLVLDLHKELHNTIILVTHSEAEADLMCDYKLHLGGK